MACRFSTGRFLSEDEDVIDSAFVMAFVRPPRLLLSFCGIIALQYKMRRQQTASPWTVKALHAYADSGTSTKACAPALVATGNEPYLTEKIPS